jgi:hypothetical protein
LPTGPPRALLLTRALLALLEKLGARTRRAGNVVEKPPTGKTARWSHTVAMRRQIGRFRTTADENVIFYTRRKGTSSRYLRT